MHRYMVISHGVYSVGLYIDAVYRLTPFVNKDAHPPNHSTTGAAMHTCFECHDHCLSTYAGHDLAYYTDRVTSGMRLPSKPYY